MFEIHVISAKAFYVYGKEHFLPFSYKKKADRWIAKPSFRHARYSVSTRNKKMLQRVRDIVASATMASFVDRVHRKARKVTALTRFDVLSASRRAKFVFVEDASEQTWSGEIQLTSRLPRSLINALKWSVTVCFFSCHFKIQIFS